MTFTIFTDGASRGNPGPGGYGAIVSDGTQVFELGGAEDNTTNNRMEVKAAVEALRRVPSGSWATLFTDSAYLANGSKWLLGWQKNGWKTTTKDDVLNRDLWEELAEVMEGKEIVWHRLAGHADIPGNERCDKIATSFADTVPLRLFHGSLADYPVSLIVDESATRGAKKNRNKAPAYSYVSVVSGKVEVHATWAECEARVKGVSGARFKKAIDADDEVRIIHQFSQ